MYNGKILRLKSVDSTNEYIKRNAAVLENGTAVIAEIQTCGKGTYGRTFLSRRGGLYLSLLLKPPYPPAVELLTPLVAVAVKNVLEALGFEGVSIKWVNDVLLSGKKVCGILCESSVSDGAYSFIAVGVGINVCMPRNGFDVEIKDTATALYDRENQGETEVVAQMLLDEFFNLYEHGSSADVARAYAEGSCLIGREITVRRGAETIGGVCVGFDEKCRMLLKTEQAVIPIGSGSVVF